MIGNLGIFSVFQVLMFIFSNSILYAEEVQLNNNKELNESSKEVIEDTSSYELIDLKIELMRSELLVEENKDNLKKDFNSNVNGILKVIDKEKEEVKRVKEEEKRKKIEEEKKKKLKKEEDKTRKITVEMTAYVADCEGCIGITKTGVDVRNKIRHEGKCIIAVDPNVIPLHSEVEVNGDVCLALDTGGLIKGNKIDLLVGSEKEAFQIGRESIEVTILN